MKFPQLPMGRRFRWRGAVYRKSGPVTAQAEDGSGQLMVPRSALVEPLDVGDAAVGNAGRALTHRAGKSEGSVCRARRTLTRCRCRCRECDVRSATCDVRGAVLTSSSLAPLRI